MLINLSNHPSINWSEKQKKSAIDQYGEIIDLPFPNIDPHATTQEVEHIAISYLKKCEELLEWDYFGNAIHLAGEPTFVVAFARICVLINLICSTTERIVKDLEDGKKEVSFNFVQFRQL
jgi:hypothetical protein